MPSLHDLLRKFALRLPDTAESLACAGTALECVTVTVNKKAFVFLRAADARFKLRESLDQAAKLAAKSPESCTANANGWVHVRFGASGGVPREQLERWIEESYRLTAGTEPKKPKPAKTKRSDTKK